MKVLLVNPLDEGNINTRLPESLNKAQGIYPPLALAYLAAVLEENGFEAKIIDSKALNLTSSELKNIILEEKADIVGISVMTSTIKGALETARIAKESNAITVMGGPHLSAFPMETVSLPFVDFGIIGEGENALLQLVNALERKKSLKGIKGLVYKKGRKIINQGFAIVDNLDKLPFPARYLLPNQNYSCIIAENPMTTMITSRGCPYKCGFCFKQPTDNKVRFRSPKKVVDEMAEVVKEYGIKEIMFYDDTMTFNKKHISGICEEIIGRNMRIKWEAPTRVNHVDFELLRLMKKAGCIRLRFGVESGCDRILKSMNKGISKEQVKKVFKWCDEIGIESFAYFIIGYIGETPETIRETINFAKEINPDWVMFTVATPYPKTKLFEQAVDSGLVDKNYWSDFCLGKRSDRIGFMVPEADKWVKRAYKEFYLRPGFILKKIKKLNSLDAFKKYFEGFKGIILFNLHGD